MRILHLAQTLTGGIASYLNEIAAAQSACYGASNVAFAIPEAQADQLTETAEHQRIPLPGDGRSLLALIRMERGMRAAIRRWKPDLLHVHSTFAGAFVRWRYLFGHRHIAIVYCAHGWSFLMETSAQRRRLFVAIERILASTTDRIINISITEHEAAINVGLPKNKLRLVENGIGAADLGKGELTQKPPAFSPNELNLLFVGRHDRQKGLDILLSRMDDLLDYPVHLHVVGSAVVGRKMTSTKSRKNVTFHGWQCRADVAKFMSAADVVVLPSRWEGFGLVAIEAMRLGRPVLASDRGALPEVVQDHITGRVFRLDKPKAFQGIITSTKATEWQMMGAAGRVRYEKKYTADRMNQSILTIYDELSSDSCIERVAGS